MKTYQRQVIKEKKELEDKFEKLQTFIVSDNFEKISKEEQQLLIEQKFTMLKYINILSKRIDLP